MLAAVKAADYWYTRYDLTNENRGFVQGATYTVVKAQIPATMLLMLIALLTAALYLLTIRTNRWRVPLVASALWLVVAIVGGVAYPALVQAAIVRPNQEEREAPYIARNVAATRAAMNLDEVVRSKTEFAPIDGADVEGDLAPLRNVRLLNPGIMLTRFSLDRGDAAGLRIADLDVDRRSVDGDRQQTLVAARELDLRNIPNQSWQGQHLVSTRGCGLVVAPMEAVTGQDRPVYESPSLDRPQLYFSPTIGGYAVTATEVAESACGEAGAYSSDSGVRMRGFFRRSAFALAFLDYNILASGAINSDSQMLWVRSVVDRAHKLAPFLHFDGDPYPVVVDGGVQWVIDAYTSTSRYPYAQRVGNVQLSSTSAIPRDANYIRNSVKVAVDAYSGEVTYYVVDDTDPIVRAWSKAFPDLFTPMTGMPEELRLHLRYPEDLFRVQTDLYSKYQVPAADFFQRRGAWSIAQAPSIVPESSGGNATTVVDPTQPSEFATESNADRFIPYYTLFRDLDGTEQFVMLRPFVRFTADDSRTELQAYMTVSSDPDTYGKLTSYEVTNDPLPSGPLRVASQAESRSEDQSRDLFAEQRRIGIERAVRRLAAGTGGQWPRLRSPGLRRVRTTAEYRFVIVSYNDEAAMSCDLGTALGELFDGFDATVGDRVDGTTALRPGSCGAPRVSPTRRAGRRRIDHRRADRHPPARDGARSGRGCDGGRVDRRGQPVVRRGRDGARGRRPRHVPGQVRAGSAAHAAGRRTAPQRRLIASVRSGAGARPGPPAPGGTRSGTGPARWRAEPARRAVRRPTRPPRPRRPRRRRTSSAGPGAGSRAPIVSTSPASSVIWFASSVEIEVIRWSTAVIRSCRCWIRSQRNSNSPGSTGSAVGAGAGGGGGGVVSSRVPSACTRAASAANSSTSMVGGVDGSPSSTRAAASSAASWSTRASSDATASGSTPGGGAGIATYSSRRS